MISKIKKMAIGQTMMYPNPPFSASLLQSAICINGREYSIEVAPAMLSRSFRITRTA